LAAGECLIVFFTCLLLTPGIGAGEAPRVRESSRWGTGRSIRGAWEAKPESGVVQAAYIAVSDELPSAFAGRHPSARRALLERNGGNEQSEAAVKRALDWIVDHQLPDGSWCFDHCTGPVVNGRERTSNHPGELRDARNAATAMALLPLLGAGHTHQHGEYQPAVQAGLNYLIGRQKPDGGWNEPSGSMYSHGLAAIAVCEAYGMTHDGELTPRAQAAVNFLLHGQDPVGGGWRYQPRQPGDTSVTGWQLAALKSGQTASLQVAPTTLAGASKFLDSVEKDGAYYGYTTPGQGPATTAIGMLCRMQLGRKQNADGMRKGVQFLSTFGPSTGSVANLYYDYYATQVLWRYGGEPWEKWNVVMRDFLIKTQAADDPARGSWFFNGGPGAAVGGRLYNTSLATLILEVYYRHGPIYARQ
jgi:hypothetical protein